MIAALGKRYREQFPTTRFNFTQPIIDMVTEDSNGTSANLAVEFTGPDSEVLLGLARQTVELLKRIRGAADVAIEQEGPQPQLLIEPDDARCARYNVRNEDVTKLIDMAIGGEPVSTLYKRSGASTSWPASTSVRGNHPKPSGGCPSIRPTACPSRWPRWPTSPCATAKPSSAASTAAAA